MKACKRMLPFTVLYTVIGLLAGCGGGTAPSNGSAGPAATKGTVADLRGGWLIAGSMPLAGVSSPGNYVFGLALNLDVINGQVTGFGAVLYPCGSNGVYSGAVGGTLHLDPASVGVDGSFTLVDTLPASSTQHQIMVQGTVPLTAGGVWSGTFTAFNSLASCNGVPPPAQGGSYTTQKIADLDGTFAGHSTVTGTTTPLTLSMTLTQGGPASIDGVLNGLNDQNVLSGTLQVQGISCFKGGTSTTVRGVPEGSVLGNHMQLDFLMDDGSTVLLNGTESDTAVSTLTNVTLLVVGGACDKSFAGFATASKQ